MTVLLLRPGQSPTHVALASLGMVLCLASCRPLRAGGPEDVGAPSGWLKGQTHLHSSNSHDGHAAPSEVLRIYESRGYDFIVFTDHDYITAMASTGRTLALPGAELTQNLDRCDPPPDSPGGLCKLHVNALFAGGEGHVELPAALSERRIDLYQRAIDEARTRGAMVQLNHPTEGRAVDEELARQLAGRGVALFEIANQGHRAVNDGDGRSPSTEALWDAALGAGYPVWGVASDDAHDFDGGERVRRRGQEPLLPDRGWIMVRSARRDAASIRAAIERGDFYATTGVVLTRLSSQGGALEVAARGRQLDFTFIGRGGAVLERARGTSARFDLARVGDGYVRAVVSDDAGHRAWTQPVRAQIVTRVQGVADSISPR